MLNMRSRSGRFWFLLFVLIILCFVELIGVKNHTKVFFAALTLGWHFIAYVFCGCIASYRFFNPKAKYMEKNKALRLFVPSVFVEGEGFAKEKDNRTNIIGLLLGVINTVLFVFFEILLFMPKIPCKTHMFHFILPNIGRGVHNTRFYIELTSWNELLPAEVSRAFAIATAILFYIFLALAEHRVNQLRRKNKKNVSFKKLKKMEEFHALYGSLVSFAVRRSKKKHKFWYDAFQVQEIERIINAATEYAELKLEKRGDKLVSFEVIDTLNDRVCFRGFFIQ